MVARNLIFYFVGTPQFWAFSRFCVRLISFFVKQTRMVVLRGFIEEQSKSLDRALECYQRAVSDARASLNKSDVRWLHPAQFFCERMKSRLGMPSAQDPLFSCSVHSGESHPSRINQIHGWFSAEFVFSGLKIVGLVTDSNVQSVDLCLDGLPIRKINVRPGSFGARLDYLLMRQTLACFPASAELEIRTDSGFPLLLFGIRTASVQLSIPHGDNRLREIIRQGGKIDKKGIIVPTADQIRQQHDAFLRVYDRARAAFASLFDKPLFLMYGTLLGYYRQGDLIHGDDDFDVGYVSDHQNPEDVKREAIEMMMALVREGFDVSFNSQGRLFRLALSEGVGPPVHIDARPLWFSDGRVWAHNHFTAVSEVSDFLPVESGSLRGVDVWIPRRTEWFLIENYGPQWRVPDPGFIYDRSRISKSTLSYLQRALITPEEYRPLIRNVKGSLIAIAEADLYPLRGMESDLE